MTNMSTFYNIIFGTFKEVFFFKSKFFYIVLFDLFEVHILGFAPNLLLSMARFISRSAVAPRSLTTRLGGRLFTPGDTWSCFCKLDLESLNSVSWRALLDLPSFWVKTSLSRFRALFSWTILSKVKDPTEKRNWLNNLSSTMIIYL